MSGRNTFLRLRSSAPLILPSLLLCDFGRLESEVRQLTAAGIEALHLDVMDGQFVPNLTYGMPIVAGLRGVTDMPLDAHLMIADPGRYVTAFREAGADAITIHIEAVADPGRVLTQIRQSGAAAGIAINPQTPLDRLTPCVGFCDLVLIMSVNAGFGGQSFQTNSLHRLEAARQMFGPDVLLEVDGGVNHETVADCAAAGAELLVVGSAIFRTDDYLTAVSELSTLANGHTTIDESPR